MQLIQRSVLWKDAGKKEVVQNIVVEKEIRKKDTDLIDMKIKKDIEAVGNIVMKNIDTVHVTEIEDYPFC